jgi:predicted aminopeptidase
MKMNNAYLLSLGLYHRHFPLFEALLNQRSRSITEMLAYLKDLAQTEEDMMKKIGQNT